MKPLQSILYPVIQCTWGFLQTFLGLVVFLFHCSAPHRYYHGAIVTEWSSRSSVSLGMFVFITKEPYFYPKLQHQYTKEELSNRLLVHEYGHTVQSMILGPLYLIAMGIPSTLWGFLPHFARKRQQGISYFSFFTEAWANDLGESVTGQLSMERLRID